MAVSKKTRFEVFTRDGFTCQYCGKQPPDTVLEVDHIIPRSRGGSDDIDNLATSCFDCNRGKAASLTAEIMEGLDVQLQSEVARVQDALEKHLMREKLREIERAMAVQEEADLAEVIHYYRSCWTGEPFYQTSSLRYFLKNLSVREIKEAIDISISQPRGNYWAYICGVCHTKIKQGRESNG
jgi:hypothetical protein